MKHLNTCVNYIIRISVRDEILLFLVTEEEYNIPL
jgi:hypothetical protein